MIYHTVYHKTMYYLLRLKLHALILSKHCDSMSNKIYTEEAEQIHMDYVLPYILLVQ